MTTRWKVCTRCRKRFPATKAFFYVQRRGLYGLRARCKQCLTEMKYLNPSHMRSVQHEWYRRHKAHHKKYREAYYRRHRKHLLKLMRIRYLRKREQILEYARAWSLRKLGITVEKYEDMLTRQQGVCAICGLPPNGKRLAVDHDHATGRVRGLLHVHCN